MSTRFDAIVIGTGQSGPSLAVRLAGAGRKVAIVDGKLGKYLLHVSIGPSALRDAFLQHPIAGQQQRTARRNLITTAELRRPEAVRN